MIEIVPAESEAQLAEIRRLFDEYAHWLGFDLCFQDYEREVAALPGVYAPPKGRLLLAQDGDLVAGCVALKPLTERRCEMKRLYVRPVFQGAGLGRRLAERIIAAARQIGYQQMVLDTLRRPMFEAARALYRSLGFAATEPYYDNPYADAEYLALDLTEGRRAAAKGDR